MFEAPNEVRTAAGYLLALSVGIVFYMRFAFPRAATDVAVRSSVARIALCAAWGATIATYVLWPDLLQNWNFFMFPQVRWFATVPVTIGILLMIWAMRSHLELGEDGNIVVSGPYAWCRYPFDAALSVFILSVTLLCGNWLLVSVALVCMGLHRLGVPYELERVRRTRLGPAYEDYAARTGWFLPSSTTAKKAQYQVPSRFSLTAIMGLLTVLAMIFGFLKAFDAPAVIYLFIGSEIVAICLVQILVGSAPRGGSALTGAILLPLWVYLTLRLPPMQPMFEFVFFGFLIGFGGLMGYCIGTLAAGFFLMMDLIEPWLIRDSAAPYQLPSHDLPVQDAPSDSDVTSLPQRKAIQTWRERSS
ncbi:MAG: isoprenylcysteine carboxylmethyltransferase family protein [Planctomycetota bacterium]